MKVEIIFKDEQGKVVIDDYTNSDFNVSILPDGGLRITSVHADEIGQETTVKLDLDQLDLQRIYNQQWP